MTIAVDAMGGDNAPGEIVAGVLLAAPEISHRILLLGDAAQIEALLPKPCPTNISIHPTTQVIGMEEKPLEALRKKKDSPLVVGANLVKCGEAQALVSAGNTGAATAASLLAWRQVQGLHRPAIASQMPNKHGGFIIIDSGASPDVDPEHLVEFAIMGRAYVEKIMGRKNPGVHLVNIGEEEGKGNAFAKEAHRLLKQHPWFRGNVEGKDIYRTPVDVVVCDAFVGNIMLKTSEGVAEWIGQEIKSQIPEGLSKLLYWPVRKVMAPLRKKIDYAEIGGSPLLGLNGVCIIAHGRSNAKAIKNALLMAQKAIDNELVETIRERVLAELPS